ncbi:hypothetical protein N9B65_00375 [Akkermansiaceae bacterium]|nr:hypothetical protein [Akkermansiaceae bacterium]
MSEVTVDAGGEPQKVKVDATDYWDRFTKRNTAAQYAEMRRRFFWEVMSPHFGLPADQWQTFLKTYLASSKVREESLLGAKNKNRVKVNFLYQAAVGIYLTEHPINQFEDLSKQPRESTPSYCYCDDDGREWRHEELATAISNLVGFGDYETFERLAAIVKQKAGRDTTETEEWHQLEATHPREPEPLPLEGESAHLQRWKIFCDYVIENLKLPTKAKLVELWGLIDRKPNGQEILDHKMANKYRKKLGLGGLPKKS